MSAGTVRSKILDYIVTNLPNIKVENGYNYTIASVKKGFFKAKSVSVYPTVCVFLGSDVQGNIIEGEFNGESNLDMSLLAYLNCPLEEQSAQAELLIEDLQRFLSANEDINPAYTINMVRDIPYVNDYFVAENFPYLTGESNLLVVGVLVKIKFIDFLDQLVPYTPTLLIPSNNSGNVGSEN